MDSWSVADATCENMSVDQGVSFKAPFLGPQNNTAPNI